jgi:hypothetical protein
VWYLKNVLFINVSYIFAQIIEELYSIIPYLNLKIYLEKKLTFYHMIFFEASNFFLNLNIKH